MGLRPIALALMAGNGRSAKTRKRQHPHLVGAVNASGRLLGQAVTGTARPSSTTATGLVNAFGE